MVKEHEGPVYLEPIKHVYIHRITGKQYSSVTKAISLIEPEFEAYTIAKAIENQLDVIKDPKYLGMKQQEILDYWQLLNDEANEYGTRVHDIVEKYLKADKWWFPEDTLARKVIEGFQNLGIDEGIVMYPERIMFAEEYQLAGMSDLIVDIDEWFFDVGDWKTNKEFNFFNKFGHQTLLKPFDHLQNCQWSIYTIQLSTYAYMYELETGKKCRQIWVGYWDKTIEKFQKIPIMYLKHEARKLLELHKYNQLAA